jgi:hypothetical protein
LRPPTRRSAPKTLGWAGLQLLEAEGGFRYLKSQLLLRPVFRRLEHRIRAHVLIRGLAALRTSALRHPKRSLLQCVIVPDEIDERA